MCNMKFLKAVAGLALVFALGGAARGQEPELINEIVARVNNDIITRADYLAAMEDFKQEVARQMQQAGKSQADISTEVERLKGTVLDILIEDMLLEQKAKELGIDVEAEVNQQMAEIAKQNGFQNVLKFEEALKQQGVDPDGARASLRRKLLQQYVVQREVLQPIFQNLGEKDKRDFYDRHKAEFTTIGEITLSEIFLPLEGRTATEVEQRARRLVAELRAGTNFVEAVKNNSPANRATRAQNGKMGTFKPGEVKEDVAAAISNLKVGEVTEPIRLQDGFQIVRVDDRKPSVLRAYDDPEVQQVLARAATMEKAEDARKKYIKQLREDAFIKVTAGYVTAQAKDEKTKN
jgi:peptidyl-prolyl cis-trans isomerase SurA